MAPLRTATTAAIPGSTKVASTTKYLAKSLSRLSRSSLIDLALQWLETDTRADFCPYLMSNRDLYEEFEEDYIYTPAENTQRLRDIYQKFKKENGTKREVIHRILDGDWRRGISLQQLAMIDFQHLQDSDSCLRWTALKLVPHRSEEQGERPMKRRKLNNEEPYPQIQASTFLESLHAEISPLVKSHYYLHRLAEPYNLTVLRIHVSDTPYSLPTQSSQVDLTNLSRTLYIALPDSCPYVYVSISGASSSSAYIEARMDVATLKRVVLEAVPKAFSRPQERYILQPTGLTTRSLSTMCKLRGSRRNGASGGAYSVFADEEFIFTPLNLEPSVSTTRKVMTEKDTNVGSRTAMAAAKRFGTTGISNDIAGKAAFDRVHIRLEQSSMTVTEEPARTLGITLSGNDVFGGIRQLAEMGLVDLNNMPAWMTGEAGTSNLTIRDEKLVNGKDGGI